MPKPIERSANYDYYADILWCCVPLMVMAWFYYGPRPLLLMLVGLFTAYICDCLVTPLHGPQYRSHEPSSEAFAALIVLMMPASVPYGIVVAAVIMAVLLKETFGGEGHYPFHPAAVGMAVAALSWPDQVFRYPVPGTELPLWHVPADTLSAGMNTTLSSGGLPSDTTMNLLTGSVAGSLGTGAILVILACGLFLLCRGHLQLSTLLPYLIVCIAVPWLLPQLNDLPVLSFPWEYVRQRVYLEKYIILSGSMLFGGIFLACEPVTQPVRLSSRIIYGLLLGVATTAFRYNTVYETGICFALLIVGAFPEWLDRVARRTERMKFMKKEEKRRAQRAKPEAI